jgi:hypothetical protein
MVCFGGQAFAGEALNTTAANQAQENRPQTICRQAAIAIEFVVQRARLTALSGTAGDLSDDCRVAVPSMHITFRERAIEQRLLATTAKPFRCPGAH